MTVQLIVLVLLLQLQEITKATDPVFVEKPQTVHTILNKTAYFQCICRGCVGQFWELNEGSPSNAQNKAKGVDADGPYFLSNGDKLYNLSMPALNELNNSNITCYIYKGATTLPSGLVHLHIQGFLSQVSNTTIVQFNITTLKQSFSAPFTLENVSILYYIIEIRDTSDVMIINTTSLTSLINIKDYCNKHMIYITPWNGLGGGETSTISDVIFYKNPQTVMVLELITDYNGTKLLNNIQFQVSTTCIGTIPQIVTIMANCSSECETVHLGPCFLHLLDHNKTSSGNCSITTNSTSNTHVIIDLSEHLLSGHYYELDVILITLEIQGISPLVKSFNISTFHTVKAEITSATLTSVCIKCTLKTGSTSQGCVVIFQDTSGKNGNISRQIDRTPGEVIAYKCIEDLPDGIYKVLITDSEIYQEKGVSNIAFELTANFVIMRPTELSTDVEETTSHSQIELASSTKTTVTSSQVSSTQDLMTSYFIVRSTSTVLTITPELTIIPKREQDTPLDVTVLPAAVCVTGVIFGLLILVIIVLLIHLIKTRKKAKRYKIGEEDALRQQRNTELLIQCSSLPISIQTLEPVYENTHEIPDKSTVLMTQSPAYETVPVHLTLPTSPN